MAYHDELLEHARQLGEKPGASQVELRRSVSAAYYALFHLLISESSANWKEPHLRHKLARFYDHGQMRQASLQVAGWKPEGCDPATLRTLSTVARAFPALQQLRNRADYDNAQRWDGPETLEAVEMVERAFEAWASIRNEPLAQEYLLMLLARGRDR